MTGHADGAARAPRSPMVPHLGDAVLFLGMVVVLATFLRLVSFAMAQSERGRVLARATAMATTLAEEFAASPSGSRRELEDPEARLVARCDVTQEATGGGVLYRATVEVTEQGGEAPVYEVSTARYVRDGGGDRP